MNPKIRKIKNEFLTIRGILGTSLDLVRAEVLSRVRGEKYTGFVGKSIEESVFDAVGMFEWGFIRECVKDSVSKF